MIAYLAIDPGSKGAVVAVDETGAVVLAERTPLLSGTFDVQAARALFGRLSEHTVIAVAEKPIPTGRSGRAFDAGYLAGRRSVAGWKAAAKGCRHVSWAPDVAPRTWQASVLAGVLGETTKDRSVAWCQQFAPDLDLRPGRCTTDHDGLADARCLAEYIRRTAHTPAPAKKGKRKATP